MRKIIVVIISLLLSTACSDNPVTPIMEPVFGVQGSIIDKSGIPITDVRIYCLYDYNYIPDFLNHIPVLLFSVDSVFENKLYQNIPNPVFNVTYIRFSLESKGFVKINLSYKGDTNIIYTYSDTLEYGLYQHYLGDLSRNEMIKNGIYTYTLECIFENGALFTESKELLLIGTENKPNGLSNEKGEYIFESREAFVGDTIIISSMYNPDNLYESIIQSNTYLLFSKEGYVQRIINFEIYPDLLYTQDVILEKEIEL